MSLTAATTTNTALVVVSWILSGALGLQPNIVFILTDDVDVPLTGLKVQSGRGILSSVARF